MIRCSRCADTSIKPNYLSTLILVMTNLKHYRGFSTKPPGGGVFIFASLKMSQEKTSHLYFDFYWSWGISPAKTKYKAWNLRKPPGGGVFIFASLAEKNRKKTPPPWGFCRETPVIRYPPPTRLFQCFYYCYRESQCIIVTVRINAFGPIPLSIVNYCQ